MHKKFDSQAIEKKWQEKWKESGLYNAGERDASKEKEYVLVEWPYPSGNLHIGHWYAFAVPDIYVRYRRMTGKQVLYPMGFDAFGLPAENAAIKRNLDPKEWTESNIAFMKTQLESMGNAFSWDMTTSSTDPEYYKWTQWMFTKFFEKDIAYRGKGVVNWCPGCNTVLANEQVLSDDTCERCGSKVEKREMDEWKIRITNYADRLVDNLDPLDWPEAIKESQRNWIGRSKGAKIRFQVLGSSGQSSDSPRTSDVLGHVEVFTTRPDTLYGVTYLVIAPELIQELIQYENIENKDEVISYVEKAKQTDEQERLNNTKEKTGVRLQGVTAINPANGEEVPVFVADYVLAGYGTGAIMAVPAHDERDGEFAKKFNLPIKTVISPEKPTHVGGLLQVKDKPDVVLLQKRSADATKNPNKIAFFGGKIESGESVRSALVRELEEEIELKTSDKQFVNSYVCLSPVTNSYIWVASISDVDHTTLVQHEGDAILEMTSEEVLAHPDTTPIVKEVVEIHFGNLKTYSGKGVLVDSGEFDGMDSEAAKEAIVKKVGGEMTNTYRLRDWSIGRQRYWGVPIPIVYDPQGKAHPIPAEHLPWTLPTDVDFKPTGEPPLKKSKELHERVEKLFGPGWMPDYETMDTFVDSSWYFLRYIDNQNDKELSSKDKQKEWMPVDLYFGGAEHTTMHLLYSRFWQKALYDLGLVNDQEPYQKRLNRGLVLGPDGNKMSKSKGNVIDPDEQVSRVGADTVKMYLAFMGPYGEVANYPWDMGGIAGIRRFLERAYGLGAHITDQESEQVIRQLHKTIKKVRSDILAYKFNTAISAMMVFINQAEKEGLSQKTYENFIKLLAPFAPHLTEELWESLGHAGSVHTETYPEAAEELAKDETVTIGVQINGKSRGAILVAADADESAVVEAAKKEANVMKYLEGAEIKKVIYVPGRILNLII